MGHESRYSLVGSYAEQSQGCSKSVMGRCFFLKLYILCQGHMIVGNF